MVGYLGFNGLLVGIFSRPTWPTWIFRSFSGGEKREGKTSWNFQPQGSRYVLRKGNQHDIAPIILMVQWNMTFSEGIWKTTWRIIPCKWLVTMVSFRPLTGVYGTLSKWPKWFVNMGYCTNYLLSGMILQPCGLFVPIGSIYDINIIQVYVYIYLYISIICFSYMISFVLVSIQDQSV